MTEPVEELDLLLAVPPDRVVGRQVGNRLPHAGPDLVREVRRRRADEGVDGLEGGFGHRRRKPRQ